MEIKDIIGMTFEKVSTTRGVGNVDDEILFKEKSGRAFKMFHIQDCCESVVINDIEGELSDLEGSPILRAEENSNSDDGPAREYPSESFTWTFYRLATAKGSVVIRWLGESNGYYSEEVDFEELKP